MSEISLRTKTVRATAEVVAARNVTPHMRRITIGGPEVAAILSVEGMAMPAAWVKVFLPTGEGRAYTIRSIDRAAGTLDMDFVLHDHGEGGAGPASAWARQATRGERIGIAGPRSGGFELPAKAQWVMLAGDATALPAIQTIAATLPIGMRAKAYVEVAGMEEAQPIQHSSGDLRTAWLVAEAEAPGLALRHALMHRPLPLGPGLIWLAGESVAVRALRTHFVARTEQEQIHVSVKGYWKSGEPDHRDGKSIVR